MPKEVLFTLVRLIGMKKIYFLLFIAFATTSRLYAQVQDNFSDGNFTSSPAWSGDAAKFEVDGNFQLHLNAPAVTDSAYLSTAIPAIGNTEWHFWYKMAFAPSASNYLTVYLLSDNADLTQAANGYYLRIGENGSNDAFNLYKIQSGVSTLIFSGVAGNAASDPSLAMLKLVRDGSGNWTMYSDLTGGVSYSVEGTGSDNTFSTSGFFGFKCTYTSTRSTLYYFDSVYVGAPIIDVTPPSLVQVNVISQNQLDVLFSETVEQLSTEDEANYTVDNTIGQPSSAVRDAVNQSLVHLTFLNNFQNGLTNNLTVTNVADLSANTLTSASLPFTFYQAQPGDVIINEIMADPDPVVSLPSAEYVELYNKTFLPIDLTGWTFTDGTTTSTIAPFTLPSGGYVTLCDDGNAALFTPFGAVATVTSMPSLNNDGDNLQLKNNAGTLINSVNYDMSFYNDPLKQDGGWSMELIDPSNPCSSYSNWHASTDASGGTPGTINSVFGSNPDVTPPILTGISIISANEVVLTFSETLDSTSAADILNYGIAGGSIVVIQATPIGPDFSQVDLIFDSNLDSNTVYMVIVNDVTDCVGNAIGAGNTIQFAIPRLVEAGDVVLNEILFNPASGGFDYIEIYNKSSKILDLKDLAIANTDDADSLDEVDAVSSSSHLFFPGDYMVLTEDTLWVHQHYTVHNPQWLVEMSTPSMNDDEGTIVLLDNANRRLDQLHYNASWQFPLINDVEGVALERISPDGVTQDSLNWHSAASTIGFGTPTDKNSQYTAPDLSDEITITPQTFSPDDDGYNDVLSIGYQFDAAGYTANVLIFDSEGREIRNLVRNALLEQSGAFTWDGTNENREKAHMGIYVVYAEIFDLNGNVKHFKKACVLAVKK